VVFTGFCGFLHQ